MKRFMDMTKEEIEADFAIATKEAQEDLHAKGLPYVRGNTVRGVVVRSGRGAPSFRSALIRSLGRPDGHILVDTFS